MNLLLHGLDSPQIDPGNALRFKLTEIGEKDRVDVIVTNPPFGGEEEKGVQGNFPEDRQTSETALLFLQLIMRKLRRRNTPAGLPSRAAIVASDGMLSTKGVAARIKEVLLNEFNLHTIVRLPRGVFVPYTPIATNLLFFDRGEPSHDIWFFEIPGPSDRQTYSKTKPFRYEEFADCVRWWSNRTESDRAWRVSRDEIRARLFDFDIQNPRGSSSANLRGPQAIVDSLKESTVEAASVASAVANTFTVATLHPSDGDARPLQNFLLPRKAFITIADSVSYRLITVQLHARGIRPRSQKLGHEIKTKKQQVVRTGDLVVAEIDAKMGGFGIVPSECDGTIVSNHYFVYEIDSSIVDSGFFEWWLRSGIPERDIQPYVKGSTNYAAIRHQHFPMLEMSVPSLAEQRRVASELNALADQMGRLSRLQSEAAANLEAFLPAILDRAFRGGP